MAVRYHRAAFLYPSFPLPEAPKIANVVNVDESLIEWVLLRRTNTLVN